MAGGRLRERSTSDLLVLLIAGTICGVVGLAMLAIFILEVIHPEESTADFAAGIADVITTLIGLLAGFLAGRTDTAMQKQREEKAATDDGTP